MSFYKGWAVDILRNVLVCFGICFYQINKFFVKNFFIIDKTSSQAGFDPRAIVCRRLP